MSTSKPNTQKPSGTVSPQVEKGPKSVTISPKAEVAGQKGGVEEPKSPSKLDKGPIELDATEVAIFKTRMSEQIELFDEMLDHVMPIVKDK